MRGRDESSGTCQFKPISPLHSLKRSDLLSVCQSPRGFFACGGEVIRASILPVSDAILADNVVKEFGEVRALKGITVGIEKGELFFLLGGSGCGKTTLLRCIAGLENPTSGKIIFDGEDVTSLPTHKREAAMVFQSYALWPHMTVGQNVAFGLEERGVGKDEVKRRVGEALEMVRLEGYGERGIDQMSGGQQQRVSLARALVVRPKVLLLDEPLSNLDARLRVEMRTEIRRIVKENDLTAVYVTHDQEEALVGGGSDGGDGLWGGAAGG